MFLWFGKKSNGFCVIILVSMHKTEQNTYTFSPDYRVNRTVVIPEETCLIRASRFEKPGYILHTNYIFMNEQVGKKTLKKKKGVEFTQLHASNQCLDGTHVGVLFEWVCTVYNYIIVERMLT